MLDSTLEMAASIPLLQLLGIHLVESEESYAVMEVTVSPDHANFFGGAHGGLLASLADTACFFSQQLIPSGRKAATLNLNLNFLRPAAIGDTLQARSELIRIGKRTANLEVRIRNQTGKVIVQGSALLMIVEE